MRVCVCVTHTRSHEEERTRGSGNKPEGSLHEVCHAGKMVNMSTFRGTGRVQESARRPGRGRTTPGRAPESSQNDGGIC